MTERPYNARSTRYLALAVLLAGTTSLSAPAFAAENQQTGSVAQSGSEDPVRIIAIGRPMTEDVMDQTGSGQYEMATDDDDEDQDEPLATQSAGREQQGGDRDRMGQDRPGRGQQSMRDQGTDDQGRHDWASREWRSARGGRDGDRQGYGGGRGDWEGGHHGRWSNDDGRSQERDRLMAMHRRMMMQGMAGRRQAPAAFRIEMGTTRMAVRCSPRETMRDCVDAALSMVTRLRDGSQASSQSSTKPTIGPDAGAPSPSTPSPAPSSPAPGSTTPTPGNSNPQ